MRYYYLVSEETDPYHNLAVEQELFRYAKDGTAVLFLWQNDHTIVIGRNQDIHAECRVGMFLGDGGTLARRRSGGGAVYHDLGNLNFSIISLAGDAGRHPYQLLLKDALGLFGVRPESNGRNDLMVNGRKFSGNAEYTDGRVLCQHGTILVCSDIGKMSVYLTPDQGKMDRNHVGSVAARVVNLHTVSDGMTVSRMRQAMVEASHAEPFPGKLEEGRVRRSELFYSGKDWIYGGVL